VRVDVARGAPTTDRRNRRKIFRSKNRHLVITEGTRGEHREMAFSGSRAGHYAPLSTDGNESSLLSRDEQVRRARVVSRTRPARPRRSRHPERNECNNEMRSRAKRGRMTRGI
jgi:GTP-dependent phosphoenolpyruvate carboxykinase